MYSIEKATFEAVRATQGRYKGIQNHSSSECSIQPTIGEKLKNISHQHHACHISTLVQGHMFSCWHIMFICSTQILAVQGLNRIYMVPAAKLLNRIYRVLVAQTLNHIYTALVAQGLNRIDMVLAAQRLNRIYTALVAQGLNRMDMVLVARGLNHIRP